MEYILFFLYFVILICYFTLLIKITFIDKTKIAFSFLIAFPIVCLVVFIFISVFVYNKHFLEELIKEEIKFSLKEKGIKGDFNINIL